MKEPTLKPTPKMQKGWADTSLRQQAAACGVKDITVHTVKGAEVGIAPNAWQGECDMQIT